MLIFLGYTSCPSLKTKQSWQKTLSRLSLCHTLSRTSHEGIKLLVDFCKISTKSSIFTLSD